MDKKQFKKFLDIHGADFSRWEGVDKNAVRDFVEQDEDAEKIHKDAQAFDAVLNCYEVDAADPALVGKVMETVEGHEQTAEAEVLAFPSGRKQTIPVWRYAGGFALAASLALAVWLGYNSGIDHRMAPATTSVVTTQDDAEAEMDVLLSEVEAEMIEKAARQEIERMWVLASADVRQQSTNNQRGNQKGNDNSGATDDDIDAFLDDLFGIDQMQETEPDVWEMIMDDTTQEL